MDHKKVSSKGGKRTLKLHGKEFFSDIGKKSAEKRLKEQGTAYYKELSARGVAARKKKAQEKKGIVERIVEAVTSV